MIKRNQCPRPGYTVGVYAHAGGFENEPPNRLENRNLGCNKVVVLENRESCSCVLLCAPVPKGHEANLLLCIKFAGSDPGGHLSLGLVDAHHTIGIIGIRPLAATPRGLGKKITC